MAEQNESFLRELEEEMRRERLAKVWDRYGAYILAVAAVIIVGVGGFKWYESYSAGVAAEAGARFNAATALIADGKGDDARQALEQLARDGAGGYGTLAKLKLAGEAVKSGNTVAAVAQFDAIASDGSADSLLRGFAAVQSTALQLDSLDSTAVKNRLNDLVGDDSPWRFSARELMALAAYKGGNVAEARQIFSELLVAPGAPQAVRQRAETMVGLIVAAERQASAADAAPTPAGGAPIGGPPAGAAKAN